MHAHTSSQRTLRVEQCSGTNSPSSFWLKVSRIVASNGRNSAQSRPFATSKKPIRSALINGLCDFEDGIGAARRRPYRTPSLTISTSDCAMLLRSRRTKRGGIMSVRHLSMRVLSVVPRHAVTVGSLQGGTVIGKTPEERGKLHLGYKTLTFCSAENL